MTNDFDMKQKKFNNNKENYKITQEIYLERQRKNLDLLNEISEYLVDFINNNKAHKITMNEILTTLSNRGYKPEETKVISQFNYLLMDLANARKNKKITGHRINIRIMYIEERLKTSYKEKLHSVIDNMMKTHEALYGLNNDAQA